MVHLLIALYAAAFALATGKVRSETRARIDAMRDHPFPPGASQVGGAAQTPKPRDPRCLLYTSDAADE